MTRPVAQRAGTKLSHKAIEKVVIGGQQYGTIDLINDLYQFGGRAKTCVLWKTKVLGLGLEEWDAVRARVGTIEFVDHDKNEAWRCPVSHASFFGDPYIIGGRQRFGIPIQCFDVYDADGVWLRKGV